MVVWMIVLHCVSLFFLTDWVKCGADRIKQITQIGEASFELGTPNLAVIKVETDLDCGDLRKNYDFRAFHRRRTDAVYEAVPDNDPENKDDDFFTNNCPSRIDAHSFEASLKFHKFDISDAGQYLACICPTTDDPEERNSCDAQRCTMMEVTITSKHTVKCTDTSDPLHPGMCPASLLGYSSVKQQLPEVVKNVTNLYNEIGSLILRNANAMEEIDNLDVGCRIMLHNAPCFLVFPKCTRDEKDVVSPPKVQSMCRDECEAMFSMCHSSVTRMHQRAPHYYQQMALLMKDLGLGDQFSEEMCRVLNNTDCVSLDARLLFNNLHRNVTQECYYPSDQGVKYGGKLAVSESGQRCVDWETVAPYRGEMRNYSRNSIHFVELYTSPKYCRNPVTAPQWHTRRDRPWCFVNYTHWEYCKVPICGLMPSTYVYGSFQTFFVELSSTHIMIFFMVIAALLLLAIGLVFVCIFFKCRRSSTADRNQLQPTLFKALDNMELKHRQETLNLKEYDRSAIQILSEIGKGEFGVVHKAEIREGKTRQRVAVKTLREEASATEKREFKKEARVMASMDHQNIVKFCGVCFDGEPLCMMFEYMPNGDLHDYICKNAPPDEFSVEQVKMKILRDSPKFLHIAIQIASGLEYLAERHYVHRDIAARNVLLGDFDGDLVPVKISDFGLSRSMYARDYYKIKSRSLLPVRWMPPESITYTRFTSASDVYSFGVLLWEIFSYGVQPYDSLSNEEVVNSILEERRLEIPTGCPEQLYDIMLKCWRYHANDRPHPKDLIEDLQKEKDRMSHTSPATIHRAQFPNMGGGGGPNSYNNLNAGPFTNFNRFPAPQLPPGHIQRDLLNNLPPYVPPNVRNGSLPPMHVPPRMRHSGGRGGATAPLISHPNMFGGGGGGNQPRRPDHSIRMGPPPPRVPNTLQRTQMVPPGFGTRSNPRLSSC